jgi:hypothetical protein
MTLAAILIVAMICAPLAAPALNHAYAPQSSAASQPQETTAPAGQETTPAAPNPPAPSQPQPAATPGKTPAGQPSSTTTKRHKKKVPQPCDNASAAGQTASASSAPPADTAATATTPPSETPKPCAPPKVIVRQGGTSEPSIQLAGGTSADQTSHKKDVVNQILGSADANLKKIAGRQLSSNQQDMVIQIRQFMNQSKAAIDVGDLERARTLAWKAETLSEDLVKPEK